MLHKTPKQHLGAKVISIHEAKIKTVQIGIETIRIGPRQVTLAIFRQLIEEKLIAQDGTLNGIPWGSVNYCPGRDCEPQGGHRHGHWHIVWQKGDKLRRACVAQNIDDANLFELSGGEYEDDYENERLRRLRRLKLQQKAKGRRSPEEEDENDYHCDDEGYEEGDEEEYIHDYEDYDYYKDGFSLSCVTNDVIRRRIARWKKTIEELATLPQLFIAV